MLIRNFKHCTAGVKITLFKTYCSSLCCCPMWTKFRRSAIGQVNVALNKVFKVFMSVSSHLRSYFRFVML